MCSMTTSRRGAALVLSIALVGLAGTASAASAQTFCVNTPSCIAAGGTSEGTIGDAFTAAHTGNDTVEIGAGSYVGTAAVGFGWSGAGAQQIHVVGAGAGQTILEPEGGTPADIETLGMSAATTGSTLSSMTIATGLATDTTTGVTVKNFAIDHVAITASPSTGAGVTNVGLEASGTSSLSDSTVTVTSAPLSVAAEVENLGTSALTITRTALTGATAAQGFDQTLRVDDSTVVGTHANAIAVSGAASFDDDVLTAASGTPTVLAAFGGSASTLVNATNDTIVAPAGTVGVDSQGVNAASSTVQLDDTIVAGAGTSLKTSDGTSGIGLIHGDYTDSETTTGAHISVPAGSPQFNTTAAPGFVDAAAGDYHLLAGSPLIDTGDPLQPLAGLPTADLDGAARSTDGRTDLGAYEYGFRAPVARIAAAAVAAESAAIAFDGSASSDADDGDALSFAWAFDDGTTATGPSVAHAFATAGPHTATLTVTDPTGRSGSASTVVTVIAPTLGGPPPPPAPRARAKTKAKNVAKLLSSHVHLSAAGKVTLSVRCAGSAISSCRGRLTLSAALAKKTRTIGSAAFSIAHGRTKTITIRLTIAARAAIARRHSLRTSARVATTGVTAAGAKTLTITPAPRKTAKKTH
jgi:hypothetical protein